jgi:hypothetical protein
MRMHARIVRDLGIDIVGLAMVLLALALGGGRYRSAPRTAHRA